MHDYSDIDDNFESADSESAGALNRRSEFVVAEEEAGQRLDRFLAAQFPDISRTHVQTLIDEGRVLVGGIAKKPLASRGSRRSKSPSKSLLHHYRAWKRKIFRSRSSTRTRTSPW